MPRKIPLLALLAALAATLAAQPKRTFNVWVFSDAHVGTDRKGGRAGTPEERARNARESLATAIRQSEDPATGFPWDIALDLGDVSGEQGTPTDEEGAELVRQFGALQTHHREQIYNLSGNHDRNAPDQPQAVWWRKWVDPTGEHTEFSQVHAEKRPYPIEGTWERYAFRAGNILFLMMSDINEPTQKIGRGKLGGNPGGVVSGETFRWWKQKVAENPEAIIITAHHYVLKNTTVASGDWEGFRKKEDGGWVSRYHGYFPEGSPQGASYLYWVDSKKDSGAFEKALESQPHSVDLWLGGHTHTAPDDTYGGKSHIETRYGGTTFMNVASLTKYHVAGSIPRSWLLTFTEGSDVASARCYLHGDEVAPRGFYPKFDRTIKLKRPFTLSSK